MRKNDWLFCLFFPLSKKQQTTNCLPLMITHACNHAEKFVLSEALHMKSFCSKNN